MEISFTGKTHLANYEIHVMSPSESLKYIAFLFFFFSYRDSVRFGQLILYCEKTVTFTLELKGLTDQSIVFMLLKLQLSVNQYRFKVLSPSSIKHENLNPPILFY